MDPFIEYRPELNTADFKKISSYIYDYCGIMLKPEKLILVQSRLQSRLKALQLTSFSDYVKIVLEPGANHPELIHMVDRLTTNKTEFFREPEHFDFLKQTVLPEILKEAPTMPISIWSAACSSGEEAYTLAMIVQDFADQHPGFQYTVLGTDLSTEMLSIARKAVYNEQKAIDIPINFKKKFLLKSVDREKPQVRIVPELRNKVSFDNANLLEPSISRFGLFDIVFCRNVLIYFDRPTQQKVLDNVCKQLQIGGYLFTGHSEALTNFDLPLEQIKSAVYKKV